MADYDPTTIIGSIFVGGGGLLAVGAFLRDYIKGRVLTDVNRDAAINGVGINQQVLNNLVDEVSRMKQREIETATRTEARENELEARVAELEKRVDELTTRLAKVRMWAMECYGEAIKCHCDEDAKARLLEHLKLIIQDS